MAHASCVVGDMCKACLEAHYEKGDQEMLELETGLCTACENMPPNCICDEPTYAHPNFAPDQTEDALDQPRADTDVDELAGPTTDRTWEIDFMPEPPETEPCLYEKSKTGTPCKDMSNSVPCLPCARRARNAPSENTARRTKDLIKKLLLQGGMRVCEISSWLDLDHDDVDRALQEMITSKEIEINDDNNGDPYYVLWGWLA